MTRKHPEALRCLWVFDRLVYDGHLLGKSFPRVLFYLVVLDAVLSVCFPFPFGVLGTMWNSTVSLPFHLPVQCMSMCQCTYIRTTQYSRQQRRYKETPTRPFGTPRPIPWIRPRVWFTELAEESRMSFLVRTNIVFDLISAHTLINAHWV